MACKLRLSGNGCNNKPMKNLYASIQCMADNIKSAIVLYSLGKDSTVMLDLFNKFMKGRYTPVFLYYCENLESKNKVIRYYEKRYNNQQPRRSASGYGD